MSDFLWPHWLQHAGLLYHPQFLGVCSNSCPLSWWCYPVFSFPAILILLPLVFPSIRVFSNELAPHIRWEKYWGFSFSISSLDEYLGLISFRINWLDLFRVKGTLKSLLQDHSSKASIFQGSAFFMVQFSHLYITNGKTIALIIQKFIG